MKLFNILHRGRFASIAAVMAGATVFLSAQGFLPTQGEVLAGDLMVAPGTGGATFGNSSSFDLPVLDENGTVYFRARFAAGGQGVTTTNDRAIFAGRSNGDLSLVIRNDDPVPAIPGALAKVNFARVSPNGILYVPTQLTGSGFSTADDTLVLMGTTQSGLSVAWREGQAAPGTTGAVFGGSFSGTSSQASGVNRQGRVMFQATLLGGDVSGTTNNTALYTGIPGALEMVLRKGAIVGTGQSISALNFINQMNDSGQLLYEASLSNTLGTSPAPTSSDRVLYRWTPGIGNELIVREGDAAPGTVGAVFGNAGNSWSVSVGANGFDNLGRCVMAVELFGGDVIAGFNDRGLFVGGPGSLSLALRKGDVMPGTGGALLNTVSNASVGLSNNGFMVFQATCVASGNVTTANDSGIWTGIPGSLQLIAREGNVAPGAGGLLFGDTMTGSGIHVNARGQVLFTNSLVDAAGTTSVNSLWSWDPVVGLRLVLLAGDSMNIGNSTWNVTTFGALQFNGGDACALGFNNAGDFAYRVNFPGATLGSSYSAIVRSRVGGLRSVSDVISAAAGGVHTMFLDAGSSFANLTHVVAASASGATPGFVVGSFVIPLNPDFLFSYLIQYPNTAPWSNTLGTLSGTGTAVTSLTLPPGIPGIAGATIHHAYALVDQGGNLVYASDASRLDIIP
jgi:hypothetical protein